MRLVRCDKCGKEIEEGPASFSVAVQRMARPGALVGGSVVVTLDVCEDCAKALLGDRPLPAAALGITWTGQAQAVPLTYGPGLRGPVVGSGTYQEGGQR